MIKLKLLGGTSGRANVDPNIRLFTIWQSQLPACLYGHQDSSVQFAVNLILLGYGPQVIFNCICDWGYPGGFMVYFATLEEG